MKRAALLLFAIGTALSLMAQETSNTPWQTEHKGLDIKVRGGYSIGLGDAKGGDMYQIDASIGKRLDNIYFGLGSGAWIGTSSGSDAIIPVTLDLETFYTKGRIAPTTLLRLGYGINTASDIPIGKETIRMPNFLITQVMPGVRLCMTRSMDIDLNVGLTGLTAVGGSKGTGGTYVYLSFGGSLNFHKSTNPKPKKLKKPTRERGMQMTLEGGKVHFSSDEDDYHGGIFALAFTYKFNHHLSAGLGFGGDFVDIAGAESQYLKLTANGEKVTDAGLRNSLSNVPKVFLRGQYNLTKKRLSPFVACDAGLRFYCYDGPGIDSERLSEAKSFIGAPASVGAYIEPALGLSVRTTNNSYLDLKVGYALTPDISGKMKEQLDEEFYRAGFRSSFKTSAPFISLGFRHTFGWGSKWGK